MITLRHALERHHCQRGRQEDWLTFDPDDRADPLADGFGALGLLNEIRIAPGTGVARNTLDDAEVLTYLHQGVLSYGDSTSQRGVLQAGEFHCATLSRAVPNGTIQVSRPHWAHFYELWLRPSEAATVSEQAKRRFSVADRRGRLCVVASVDARQGSLRIREDALIYSALLDPGQHMARELPHGRNAWLHVVCGAIALGDIVLTAGDGAGIREERAISFAAREKSEILLVDLLASQTRWPS
jgi:redox-sensitive bicupin YhaK (pirin superfamily)